MYTIHRSSLPMEDYVVLVNQHDEEIGVMDKYQAHREGQLHRAFSVCVFNRKGELLLQRRHPEKYHSGGLWSNTCCSHPRPGEAVADAAQRRLQEEMGFQCAVEHLFGFVYHTELDNDLTEYEFDHVFIGRYDGIPAPNLEEVDKWEWVAPDALQRHMLHAPEAYTYWFRLMLDDVLAAAQSSADGLERSRS